MEEQNLISQLGPRLKQKAFDNITYRKAAAIYQSLIESTTAIPNYHQTIANTETNFAIFVFGSVFKLLNKATQNQKDQFNIDAYILLMGLTIAKVNLTALQQTKLLPKIQNQVFKILTWNQSSPLMVRHAISILNNTLSVTLQDDITRSDSLLIVQKLFEISIQNARNNILSKESSKLLCLIVRNNVQIGKLLANEVKKSLLQGLQNRAQLYLNNVRDVIGEFPLPLLNDIVYRVTKNLVDVDHENQANQNYLSQLYFFIEKLVDKLSISTLEEVLKTLIDNIPQSTNCEKVIFCYLQCLYEVILQFCNKNTNVAIKYLSSVISVFQEFLLAGSKTEKHAFSLFKFLMKNAIRQQLWVQNKSNDIGIEEINLDGTSETHHFGKVICMLKSMLSNRFPNKKNTAGIFCEFFQSLDHQAFSQVQELIVEVVNFREEFDEKSFKRVMHSIFVAFGPKSILEMYPPTIQGDISQESFQSENNLWILGALEKYTGEEDMQVFGRYFVPILGQIKNITQQPGITKIRKQAYLSISDIVWHCFKVFARAINKKTNYESVLELVDNQINLVSESTLDHISVGLERLCQNLYRNEYRSKISENLIKHFAASLNLDKSNSKQILQAIKSLSLITNKDYLNRVFQKNIVKLLEACEKHSLDAETTVQTNLKNMEILMAVCTGINFNDPSVISSYRISKEQLVVKLIQYLIAEKNIFQKKGYKFILETINNMPQSFTQQIVEIIQNDQKVLPASKHYRIAILYQLWQRLKGTDETQRNIENIFNFIKAYLPQILIALKESNKRARKEAVKIFEEFFELLNQMGLVQNFIEIICAGFTSTRTEIKVATIYGLGQIIIKKDLGLEKSFLQEVFELVLMLLKQKKHQIYKAVIDFSKKYVLKLQKSEQLETLPNLIRDLFLVDEESKMEERSILKHFLLKLVKRHERQTIQKMIPQEDKKILSNAIKVENRLKKKKREQNQLRRQQREQFKKAQQTAESQSSSDESSAQEEAPNEMKDEKDEDQLQALDNTDNLLLKYDLEKENFHFEEKKLNIINEQRNLRKQKELQKQEDVVFDEDGFMVVRQDSKRRKRDETQQNAMDEEGKQATVNHYLNMKKKVKSNFILNLADTVHQVKESGESFRSNRAGGDVRRKDQPEPYAFIQFNQKALNKRFKKKAEKIFDTIFQRKQGGLKGIKSRVLTKSG